MELKELFLKSGYDEQYVNFINRYRGNQTNLAAHRWQYSHIPEKSVLTAIMDGETIIGTQSMMPVQIQAQGKTFLSSKSENTYLDPSLRGKKMFKKIYDLAWELSQQKGLHVAWGFTPALKAFVKVGFTPYENCLISSLLYLRIPSIKSYFSKREGTSNIKNSIGYLAMVFTVIYSRLYLLGKSISSEKGAIEEIDTIKKEEDMDELYENIKKVYPKMVYIVPSEQYLNWRMDQNPNMDFQRKYFYQNGKLIAYCFYYMDRGTANISSLVYAPQVNFTTVFLKLISSFKRDQIGSLIVHGNFENELNKKIFMTIKKINLRPIVLQGQSFIYMFSDKSPMSEPNKGDWLVNNLWTEGY